MPGAPSTRAAGTRLSAIKGTTAPAVEIEKAIEVFDRGFCFTPSRTHPYLAERLGPVWLMRDAPRRSGDYRSEQFVSFGVPAAEVDAIAHKHGRTRFAVCAIAAEGESVAALARDFKALGYRLVTTEPFMVHDLRRIPAFASPATLERITTPEVAAEFAKLIRKKPLRHEFLLPDSPLRQYIARVDGELVGWVTSIAVASASWCSNMFVAEAHRRHGIARSLLSLMLMDARKAGAKTAVLLSSHTGAMLYPVVGYHQIGTLLALVPKRT